MARKKQYSIEDRIEGMSLTVARATLRHDGIRVPRSNVDFKKLLRKIGLIVVKTKQSEVPVIARR